MRPHYFDLESAEWTVGGAIEHPVPRELRVVTWNIWLGEHRWTERLDALIDTVGFSLPDVVGLQEVAPRQLDRLLKSDWVRAGYLVSDVTSQTLRPHGVLLLSRLPILNLELVELPSRRHRKLLLADLDSGSCALRLALVHLESGEDGRELRERQLRILHRRLQGAGPALLLGDLNFDLGQGAERRLVSPGLVDCWRSVHGDLAGNTLDASENALRAALGKRSGPMRCDGLLLRPGPEAWHATAIWRLGLEPISGGEPPLYPSDHFGLAARLSVDRAQTAGG